MDFTKVIQKIRTSLPLILVADSNNQIVSKGSGFIYQEANIVVTCAHVVDGQNDLNVYLQFHDNEEFIPANVAIMDREHDIALLKFQPDRERQPLRQCKDPVEEGQLVIFSGYPLSLVNLTTHQGIISSIIQDPTGMTRYLIDGTVNPGNSGGPLMSISGEVLGVIDATRRENNDVISKLKYMTTGALSLHGMDLVELYNALANNLQLGVGYAVPAGYVPEYPKGAVRKSKEARKSI